ncbi:MAG: hypothetical protein P8099_17060 [Gemmatimonadota bacterium]
MAATCAAPASFVRRLRPSNTVPGSSHNASAPSNVPVPATVRRIGTPSSASRRATHRTSPARTGEAGRPTMTPSGVASIVSATKTWLGGGGSHGST